MVAPPRLPLHPPPALLLAPVPLLATAVQPPPHPPMQHLITADAAAHNDGPAVESAVRIVV